MSGRVRVLVVDDSAFARKVLREVLSARPGLEVVGVARDGLEALEKIAELRPDVLTLDLVMPGLDGLGVLRELGPGAPRVVVVSFGDPDSELALEALRLGAVALVHKPTNLATDRLYELGAELAEAVELAAAARPAPPTPPAPAAAAPLPARATARQALLLGASTGGPQALTTLLTGLPADFPLPVAVVLHMPVGFTEIFAQRLNEEAALEVLEASEGLELRPGRVVVARAGMHLVLVPGAGGHARAHLDIRPIEATHRPAVDVLFESAARVYGAGALGVVLTGMGDDGLRGSRAIVEAGGLVLAEAESTAVVYGMPRVVAEAGLAAAQVPIGAMVQAVLERL